MADNPCTTAFHLLRQGSCLRFIIKSCPLSGWCLGLVLVLWRGLVIGATVSAYRTTQAESYRPALEPEDHEMIDFLVKRFKLWLGVSKVKEYRHRVKFEGLDSHTTRSSRTSSRARSLTLLPHRSSYTCSQEVPASPTSPRPILSPGLAVEHLPRAVTDLLDSMDKVTALIKEVSVLERKLKLWQLQHKSRKAPEKNIPPFPGRHKQLSLPRTYSTFSESALTRMRSKMGHSDSFSRRAAPDSAGLPGNTASAGMYKTRLSMTRPHSHERARVLAENGVPSQPIPRKRRAWDAEP